MRDINCLINLNSGGFLSLLRGYFIISNLKNFNMD